MMYVSQLPIKDKYTLYKRIKGYCYVEGIPFYKQMIQLFNEKAVDVMSILDYDVPYDTLDKYKECIGGF